MCLSAHQLAGAHPGLAVEADELSLLDGVKIRRARIDPDAGQKHRQLQVFQVRCLPYDVLARKVIAALPQDRHQRLRHTVSVYVVNVLRSTVRVVLLHECEIVLSRLLVLPRRIVRVLYVTTGDETHRLLEASRLQYGRNGDGDVVEKLLGFPTDVIGLADGLSCELGRSDVEESICARGLQGHDLGIDGRIAYLVGHLRDDHPCSLSDSPYRSRRSDRGSRSSRWVCFSGCTSRRCGSRAGTGAASPSSMDSARGLPIWSRPWLRTAEAPSSRSCTCGWRCWAACRGSGR